MIYPMNTYGILLILWVYILYHTLLHINVNVSSRDSVWLSLLDIISKSGSKTNFENIFIISEFVVFLLKKIQELKR